MENDEGDFIIRDVAGSERFCFSATDETLFIKVTGARGPDFTFIADITEAEGLQRWLAEKTAR